MENQVASGNITQLLAKWSDGDQCALDELMPLVYDELRQLARSHLRRQAHSITIQPTALVHEAYLRLAGKQQLSFKSRAQFFGLAAKLIHDLLIDYVRQRRAAKRGGEQQQVSLSYADQAGKESEIDLLALDEALQRLEAINPQHSRIVELRFFGGLTIEETAAAMSISHATVERDWSMARTWLYCELNS
jgi:RNA polymerase sigma factor (TIGR02999 family)